MPQSQLLHDGLLLLLYGMGIVFVFLTLLYLSTVLMSQLVLRFSPNLPQANSDRLENTAGISDERVSVITTAIHLFRKNK